jgi:hypothetical protein
MRHTRRAALGATKQGPVNGLVRVGWARSTFERSTRGNVR